MFTKLHIGFKAILFYIYIYFHEFYDMLLISIVICSTM